MSDKRRRSSDDVGAIKPQSVSPMAYSLREKGRDHFVFALQRRVILVDDEEEDAALHEDAVAPPGSLAGSGTGSEEEGSEGESGEGETEEEETTMISNTDAESDGEESVDDGGKRDLDGESEGNKGAGGIRKPDFQAMSTNKAALQPGEKLKALELLPTEFPDK